ncbi:RNA polymerase sigma factor [Kangiella japonica]|uniref:RNA polymerase sigma factor n=1 Tax=Kangiella japonica TaxID=647384 RepID=A0ABN0SVQ8_9GAMM
MNDLALVKRVLSNAPGSFDELVQSYQKLVWQVISRLVQNQDDTLELSQEVFLQVYYKLEQFKGDSSLATWIGRVAYNFGLRFLQKQGRALPIVEGHSVEQETSRKEADELGGQFERVQQLAIKEALAEALAHLPPEQRTIISLYHFNDMTTVEIAEICNMPQGTVKSHLSRARERLKSALESSRKIL